MALFSRRPKNSDDDPAATAASSDAPADAPENADAVDAPTAEPVPHVNISVSTFGSTGSRTSQPAAEPATGDAETSERAPARPAHLASPPAEASTRLETVPGLRDNVLLRDALAALPTQAQPTEMINVARQLLQGHVYIRVQGDARELLAQGKSLPTSMVTFKDQKYMLVYSGGAALQNAIKADGDAGTSALAQPVLGLLQQVASGPMGGVAVDHASRPGSALLPKQLIEKAVADADPALRVKTLLAAPRTAETAGAVAEALTAAPLWIAARRSDDGQVGIAELRTPEGARLLEVFSHPLELLALGRGDQPVKVEAVQLAKALRGDTGLSGVVVDPAGPWIRLTRDQLHPLLIVGT
jgi:hypothetical protein